MKRRITENQLTGAREMRQTSKYSYSRFQQRWFRVCDTTKLNALNAAFKKKALKSIIEYFSSIICVFFKQKCPKD